MVSPLLKATCGPVAYWGSIPHAFTKLTEGLSEKEKDMTKEQRALGSAYIVLSHLIRREELAEDKELIDVLNSVSDLVGEALTTDTMIFIAALSFIGLDSEND